MIVLELAAPLVSFGDLTRQIRHQRPRLLRESVQQRLAAHFLCGPAVRTCGGVVPVRHDAGRVGHHDAVANVRQQASIPLVAFFGTPAIVDVGPRAHPSGRAAVRILERCRLGEVPSIRAVALPETVLVDVLRPRAERRFPTLAGPTHIVRVKQLEPVPAGELVCGYANELRAAPVEIRWRPVRRCGPDDMRDGLEDRAAQVVAQVESLR